MSLLANSHFFVNPSTAPSTVYPDFFPIIPDPMAPVIVAEQAREARRQNGILADTAMAFLLATSGNPILAHRIADNFLNLMFEDGCFCQWRYRIFSRYLSEGD